MGFCLRYILSATDLFTMWVLAKPLRAKNAEEVGQKILHILMDLGPEQKVITDQGREFVNNVSIKKQEVY